MTQRFRRHPFLALFDGPDTNVSTAQRRTSTVPLQALYMMNNEFVRTRAKEFAARLLQATEENPRRIELAHLMAWNRPPSDLEKQKAKDYLLQFEMELERQGKTKAQREIETWASYARILFKANAFIYVD